MKASDLIAILKQYPDAEVTFIDTSDNSALVTKWLSVNLAAYDEDTDTIQLVD